MKLYYDFLDESHYSTMSKKEREMIALGLKRFMCTLKAPYVNDPNLINVECRDYPSR